MKKLETYIKNLYISLEDINEELKDKIKNLEGYEITECCDCGYTCDEPKCCEPNPVKIPTNQFGRFNSEQEITYELDSKPTVNTLYDIHNQFGRFSFISDVNKGQIEPIYFGNNNTISSIEVSRQNGDMPSVKANPDEIKSLYSVPTNQNKKIYKVVTDIINTYGLVAPVIQTKINGEVQVYTIKNTGSNGKENSIKSSLEEISKLLGKLDSKSEIQWSQVLDVAIDNIDDVYSFVITFVLNPNKFIETIKTDKII